MGPERTTCPRCISRLIDRDVCPVCGYSPASRSSVSSAIADTLLGHMLAGYLLEEVIGSSPRGCVFSGRSAHALHDGRRCAVKVVAHDRSRAKVQDRLIDSARGAVGIACASLATLLDVGADTALGAAYFASEFAPGVDLARTLDERGQLDVPAVARIGRDVALALAALHAHGALHRDVKPAHVVIADDGPARLVETGFPPISQFSSGHGETAHAPIVGTATYAAPEMARDSDSPPPASDVYALGGMLYHLLTGRPPFVADSPIGLLVQHATRAAPPVRSLAPATPEGLAHLVERMLSKVVVDRPSATEVAAALESADAGDAVLPVPGAREAVRDGQLRLSRSWLRRDAALAALLVERGGLSRDDIEEALAAQIGSDLRRRTLGEILLERGIASRQRLGEAVPAIDAAQKRRLDAAFGRKALDGGYVKQKDLDRALAETGDTWISVSHSLIKRGLVSERAAAEIMSAVAKHLREDDTVAIKKIARAKRVPASALATACDALGELSTGDDRSLVNILLEYRSIDDDLAWGIWAEYVRAHLP